MKLFVVLLFIALAYAESEVPEQGEEVVAATDAVPEEGKGKHGHHRGHFKGFHPRRLDSEKKERKPRDTEEAGEVAPEESAAPEATDAPKAGKHGHKGPHRKFGRKGERKPRDVEASEATEPAAEAEPTEAGKRHHGNGKKFHDIKKFLEGLKEGKGKKPFPHFKHHKGHHGTKNPSEGEATEAPTEPAPVVLSF